MKSGKTKVLLSIFVPLLIIALLFFSFYWSRTTTWKKYSPEGNYVVTSYYTDVGGWGYRGKIYISKTNFLAQKHWTGVYVPASITWLSDDAFEITKDGETYSFNVSDFSD